MKRIILIMALAASSAFAEHVYPANPDPNHTAFFGQLGRDSIVVTNAPPAVETDPTVPGWAKEPTKPDYSAEEVGALPVEGGEMSGDIGMGENGLYEVGYIEADGPISTADSITAEGSAEFGGVVSAGLDIKTEKDLYVGGDTFITGNAEVRGELSVGASTIGQVGLENGDVEYIYNGRYVNLTDLHADVGGKVDKEHAADLWTPSKTFGKGDIVTVNNSLRFYLSLEDRNAGNNPASSAAWAQYNTLAEALAVRESWRRDKFDLDVYVSGWDFSPFFAAAPTLPTNLVVHYTRETPGWQMCVTVGGQLSNIVAIDEEHTYQTEAAARAAGIFKATVPDCSVWSGRINGITVKRDAKNGDKIAKLSQLPPPADFTKSNAVLVATATDIVREHSGDYWDAELQVWWTGRMSGGKLTYMATTNVNLNAEH